MSKYTIGVDFGTESGRAVLVDVKNGREVATAVYPYSHGVMDEKLPDTEIRLEPDWALQDPQDYVRVFQNTIPTVLKESRVNPDDVIGLGIDFTACTMLPTKADGTPLCALPEFRAHPHAWVKLWKHHAAQPEFPPPPPRLIEAPDWIVWQLTGRETRNSCTAGYKAIWSKQLGFPSES